MQQSFYATWISSAGDSAGYLTIGLVAAGCLGLASCLVCYIIKERFGKSAGGYFKALLAIMPPGLLGTTANTWLIKTLVLTTGRGFTALIVPRVSKELLITALNAYVLTAVVTAYNKAFAKAER
jgi:hypothetical protein